MFIFSSSNVLDKSLLSLSKTMEGGQRVSQGKNITTLLCYASFFTEASTPTYQGEIMTFVYLLTSIIFDNKHKNLLGITKIFLRRLLRMFLSALAGKVWM